MATILSAQCTDERVNIVTKNLFPKYPRAEDYGAAPIEELEEDIRSTGFFRNKAKSIKNLGKALVEKHQGQVPPSLEEMVKLPGVGRKTANVVLATAFGIPGLTVDTHVGRLSQRLGLTENKGRGQNRIRFDGTDPQGENGTVFSLQLIAHGRQVCSARKPKCGLCALLRLCPFGQE